jgi:HEPN domain-containing protein
MRTHDQVVWDFVQSWLAKAEGDIAAAEHLLTLDTQDHWAAAFHAEQAGEKLLKALLVRHQIPFPKTHDIQRLLDLAEPKESTIANQLRSAVMLTRFGVEFRYPGEEVADMKTAQDAIGEAKKVQKDVLARLRGYLDKGRPGNQETIR